jgi:hypothetical protein
MVALSLLPHPSLRAALRTPVGVAAELHAREPRLALYGALLLALLLPMAVAWGLDDRVLRGANVWIKPMKFALSIAVLALTTAWFAGYLPARVRAGRAMDWIVWLLVLSGSFELGYIALQAGFGQGSHYNVAETVHNVMYALMGVGALILTGTQPMLAWQLHRHGDRTLPSAYRLAVQIGLVLTFVLGAGAGMLLSTVQPPDGSATLPIFGWSLQRGDLRPAHFVGIHAEQVLPFVAFVAGAIGVARANTVVWAATLLYAGLFGALLIWALS